MDSYNKLKKRIKTSTRIHSGEIKTYLTLRSDESPRGNPRGKTLDKPDMALKY